MKYSNIFVILFIIGTVLNFLVRQALEFINFKFRKNNSSIAPELSQYITTETLEKTKVYKNADYALWIPKSVLSLALTFVLVVSGFYVWLINLLWVHTQSAYWTAVLFMILTTIPSSILNIPFSLIDEFKIEKKFGFSNMTFGLWLLDEVKSFVLSLVITIPLVFLIMAVLIKMNTTWWLLVSLVIIAFSLILSWIYPVLLAPLFNKFLPLEEGELKTRLEALLKKCGFKSNGIFRMDESKRSNHSNAYFTGFGKNKRIVLYDTLIKQLTPDEIEAVLGHELGHYKKHHIVKKLCVSLPMIFAVMFVISLFSRNAQLFEGFGFVFVENAQENFAGLQTFISIFLMNLVFGDLGIFFNLITNFFSRKDEFEADAFSAKVCNGGDALISSLIKLNKENLSEIEVPKIYSAFYYSHPQLLERIKKLKN